MEKFCLFCGKKPALKSKEHVIPQWLIKLTGDPNRDAYFGLNWNSPDLEKRRFSSRDFTFSACKDCNETYSHLENSAHSITKKIISHSELSSADWNVFFDWLDKIRTGLWLGMIYLNKNHRGLTPMFHIDRRIGSKDRLLIIYEIIDDGQVGIGWTGTETPLFEHIPSCFIIGINNFLFFNISYDFLFSERFGFPYPSKREVRSGGGEWIDMQAGHEIIQFPLIEKKFQTGGTQLFQPMIPYGHFHTEKGGQSDLIKLYDNDYVRENCMDFKVGRGLIFRREGNNLVSYSKYPSYEWVPKNKFPRGEIFYRMAVQSGEVLEELFRNHASFDALEKEERDYHNAEVSGALKLHETIMKHLKNQKKLFL